MEASSVPDPDRLCIKDDRGATNINITTLPINQQAIGIGPFVADLVLFCSSGLSILFTIIERLLVAHCLSSVNLLPAQEPACQSE